MEKNITLRDAVFYRSAPDIESIPCSLHGVLFVGRSNAGKSTLINALTGQRQLMKTSQTPGKTRMLNFSTIGDKFFLIDSPGYGFEKSRDYFEGLMDGFFKKYVSERGLLRGIVMVMDSRRALESKNGVGQGDFMMEGYAKNFGIPIIAVFTKVDKLSFNERKRLEQIYSISHRDTPYFMCSPKDIDTYKKLGLHIVEVGCGLKNSNKS